MPKAARCRVTSRVDVEHPVVIVAHQAEPVAVHASRTRAASTQSDLARRRVEAPRSPSAMESENVKMMSGTGRATPASSPVIAARSLRALNSRLAPGKGRDLVPCCAGNRARWRKRVRVTWRKITATSARRNSRLGLVRAIPPTTRLTDLHAGRQLLLDACHVAFQTLLESGLRPVMRTGRITEKSDAQGVGVHGEMPRVAGSRSVRPRTSVRRGNAAARRRVAARCRGTPG